MNLLEDFLLDESPQRVKGHALVNQKLWVQDQEPGRLGDTIVKGKGWPRMRIKLHIDELLFQQALYGLDFDQITSTFTAVHRLLHNWNGSHVFLICSTALGHHLTCDLQVL